MTDSIEKVIQDMQDLADRYDSIGGGHAAMPFHHYIKRLKALIHENEDAQWRFELCEKLGMSCAAGHKWSVDEVIEYLNYLLNAPPKTWDCRAGTIRGHVVDDAGPLHWG